MQMAKAFLRATEEAAGRWWLQGEALWHRLDPVLWEELNRVQILPLAFGQQRVPGKGVRAG